MTIKTSRILLIAETLIGVSCLAACLKGWECSIHFTISREEANTLVRKQQFDIVLSEFGFWNESSHPLAALLIGSDTTLVYSYPVETGCWWLPAVKNGQSCWGSLSTPRWDFSSAKIILPRRTIARSGQPAPSAWTGVR